MPKLNEILLQNELSEIEKAGILVEPEKDYSSVEIEELYNSVTDDFPYEYDQEGNPLHLGQVFERIIDKLLPYINRS